MELKKKNEHSGVTRRKIEITEWYLIRVPSSKSQNIIIKKYTFDQINGPLNLGTSI